MQLSTATLPETATLANSDRSAILSFASWLLPYRDRVDPEAVTSAAGPLLGWAREAISKDDLRARMAAMGREHDNASPKVTEPVDPEEFLTRARVYYEFITGVTR